MDKIKEIKITIDGDDVDLTSDDLNRHEMIKLLEELVDQYRAGGGFEYEYY